MLKIGDKIKSLRKAQDITQEKLAAYLNISYQAVSKWENGTALPDITLVPQIANFFGVSADELLGMKETEETEELKEYEKIYHENKRLGKMFDNIVLSREVLTKYPRNYQWMLNLSYPLMQYDDTDEHHKYSLEHGFREEAIGICERILEDCTIEPIRHSAIQILCYGYADIGKQDLALKLANEMPDMFSSKEHLLNHIYKGEEKIKSCQNTLMAMIDMSASIISMLSSPELMGKELTVLEKIDLKETGINLYKLILKKDENSLFYNCRLCRIYAELAQLWCSIGENDKAIEYLLLTEKTAVSYDKCVDLGEQSYKSLLANRCTFNPKSVGKNFEDTETQILIKILNNDVFNELRKTKDFIELQNRLLSYN